MGLRAKVARLEKSVRGQLDYFELADDRRYYYEPMEAFKATFLFWCDSLKAVGHGNGPRPEPPEVLKAVAGAKDRGEALRRVMGGGSHLPLDREALVERGEFVPRSLVAGRDADEPVEDPSE